MVSYLNIWILIASVVILTRSTATYRLSTRQQYITEPTPPHVYIYDRSQRLLEEPHHLCRKPGSQCLDEHRLQICTGLLRPKVLIYCNLKSRRRPYCNNVERECSAQRSPDTNDEFICPGTGFYPDPYDCQIYYDCNNIDGLGILHSCADSNVFNFDQQICLQTLNLKKLRRMVDCRRKWRKLIRYQNTTSLYGYCDPNSVKIRLFECHREYRLGSKCIFNSTTNEFELKPEVRITMNPSSSTNLTSKQMKQLNKRNKRNKRNKTLTNIYNDYQFPFEDQIERYSSEDIYNNIFFDMSTIIESMGEEEFILDTKSEPNDVNKYNEFNDKLGSDMKSNGTENTMLSGSHSNKMEFIANNNSYLGNSEISNINKLSSITDLTYIFDYTDPNITEIIYDNSSYFDMTDDYFIRYDNYSWGNNSSVTQKAVNGVTNISLIRLISDSNEKEGFLINNTKLKYKANEKDNNNNVSIIQQFDLSNAQLFVNDSNDNVYSSVHNVKDSEKLSIIRNDESNETVMASVSFTKISSTKMTESASMKLRDIYERITNKSASDKMYENTNLTAADIGKTSQISFKILDGIEIGSVNEQSSTTVKVYTSEPSDGKDHSQFTTTTALMSKDHNAELTVPETSTSGVVQNCSSQTPENDNEQHSVNSSNSEKDNSINLSTHDYTIESPGEATEHSTITERIKISEQFKDVTLVGFGTESHLPNSLEGTGENATDLSNRKEATLTSQKTNEDKVPIVPHIQEGSLKTTKTYDKNTLALSLIEKQLSTTANNYHTSERTTDIFANKLLISDKIHHTTTSSQLLTTTSGTLETIDNTKPLITTNSSGITDSEEHAKNTLAFENRLTSVQIGEYTTTTSLDDQKYSPTSIKNIKDTITPRIDLQEQAKAIVRNSGYLPTTITDDTKPPSTSVKTTLSPFNVMEHVYTIAEMGDYRNSETIDAVKNTNSQDSITVQSTGTIYKISSTSEIEVYNISKLEYVQKHSPTNINDVTILTTTEKQQLITVNLSEFHKPVFKDVKEQSSTTVKSQDHIILPIEIDKDSSTTVKVNSYQTPSLTSVDEQSTTYFHNQGYHPILPSDTQEQSLTTMKSNYNTSELTDAENILTSDTLTALKIIDYKISEASQVEKQSQASVKIQEPSSEERTSTEMKISNYAPSVEIFGAFSGKTDVTIFMNDTTKTEVYATKDNYTGIPSHSNQDVGTSNSSTYYTSNLHENKTYVSSFLAENEPELDNSVFVSVENVITQSSGCNGFIHISGTFRNFDPHFVII